MGGRKAVVFFSDGIDLPGVTLPGSPLQTFRNDELVTRFHRLIDKANRSGAVVYTVDARGLVYLAPEQLDALGLSQQGLLQLAEDTGGFATVNSNGLSDAMQHIEEQQRGYYLIGFKAPENISAGNAGSKPDYHSIKVTVNGPGLRAPQVRDAPGADGGGGPIALQQVGLTRTHDGSLPALRQGPDRSA